jgi:hypothetical protein
MNWTRENLYILVCYCLSQFTDVFLSSLLSFSVRCCLSQFAAAFLSSLLSFSVRCCLSQFAAVFLSSLLSFSVRCCLSQFGDVFLSSLLYFLEEGRISHLLRQLTSHNIPLPLNGVISTKGHRESASGQFPSP